MMEFIEKATYMVALMACCDLAIIAWLIIHGLYYGF